MIDVCLRLACADRPTIVEEPFARNGDYVEMLSELRPARVKIPSSLTGTSAGAVLLLTGKGGSLAVSVPLSDRVGLLRSYA
jgi:hypothetical protein